MRGTIANGERIVALRASAGLTQELLAAKCECDVKTLRNAERSKRVDVATLRRIAARLEVAYGDIVAPNQPERLQANIVVAKDYIRAFNARDPDAVAACFHEDGSLMVFADPRLPGSGEVRGREQIRNWAVICFESYLAEPINESMYQVDAAGDFVFVRVDRPTLTALQTGKQSPVSLISEFEIADGRIVQMRTYPESGAVERIALTS